jgi:hypothetical protein
MHDIIKKPEIGDFIEGGTGQEVVVRLVDPHGVSVVTTDRVGRTWRRERDIANGRWTRTGRPDPVTVHNVSNLAAFGVEWTDENSGTSFQLYNLKSTPSLYLGIRTASNAQWSTTRVVDPERFGLDRAPRNFKEFHNTVTVWFAYRQLLSEED